MLDELGSGSKINYGPDAKIILDQGFVFRGGIVWSCGAEQDTLAEEPARRRNVLLVA